MNVSEAIANARQRLGFEATVDLTEEQSIVDVFENGINEYGDRPAFSSFGHTLTYRELDQHSRSFAAWLQSHTDLQPGDSVAVQLVNVIQYPIVLFGIMRAGMVAVNTNPLYTEREMLHQFKDSGAKGLVILANMADKAEAILDQTQIKTLVVTEIADMLPAPKRWLINGAVKYLKKMVPAYHLPNAQKFLDVLKQGEASTFTKVACKPEDVAVLQYTGGTTGVAKGAMLTHSNLVANMRQARCLLQHLLSTDEQVTMICPLPLYHIYAFTVHCMVGMEIGAHNVLIPNPRDLPAFVKALQGKRFHVFVGLNTLFVALANNAAFKALDFSGLKMTLSGGMALTEHASSEWQKVTGCPVTEGYGLTETSPIACANPPGHEQVGCIGLPVPNTELKVVNDQGEEQPVGEAGELCIRGPQVMKGYWQRPGATAESIKDGWFYTGDIALIQEDGYAKIVDRAKDMILVSGFNVYPNELENVLTSHPDVVECAAIGMPHDKSGEVVKMFVVRSNPELTEQDVIDFMRSQVTSYKRPKVVEFRDELPKSNVGKILRKELRT
ncbi:MAG: AMP-binding protein [Cellvibrionaceae bacterium]